MRPSAELSWQSAALQGHLNGPYAMPDANLQLRIRGVQAGEAAMRNLEVDLTGNKGAMAVHAILEGFRIPGARPDLFAAAPLRLQAHARLDDPARPVEFGLKHPLLAVQGRIATAGDPGGTASVTVPALGPFAEAAGIDLEGRTTIAMRIATKKDVTRVDADGSVELSGGAAPLPALIGSDAKVALSAALRGDTVTVERARLDGRTMRLSATGTRRGDAFDFKWQAAMSDLAALAPALRGTLSAEGRARGTSRELALETDARGEVGTAELAPEKIEAHLSASGPPTAASGEVCRTTVP